MDASVRPELFPLCRSITGNGLRRTLKEIQRHIPLDLHEVPTGTPGPGLGRADGVERPRRTRIETLDGKVMVDFADSNLHVVGYSTPVERIVSRAGAGGARRIRFRNSRIWCPYRTGYYAGTMGFLPADRVWEDMQRSTPIASRRKQPAPGSLTYGEL